MDGEIDEILDEQGRYYEDRAAEYDDVWFRRGIYDLGPEGNARWFAETATLEAAIDAFCAEGTVLELAAGTGLITRHLVARASTLIALDAAEHPLAINRERFGADQSIAFVHADVFEWEPPPGTRFDAIVFAFLISHLPPDRFDAFFDRLRGWLAPGGRLFFCDDLEGAEHRASTVGEPVLDGPAFALRRQLTDGREYTIVKVYYAPEELESRLGALGWRVDVRTTGSEFFYAEASIAPD